MLLRSLMFAWMLALTQGWAICSVEEMESDWRGDEWGFGMFWMFFSSFQSWNAVSCCSYYAAWAFFHDFCFVASMFAGMRSINEEPKQASADVPPKKVGSFFGSFLQEDVGHELDQSEEPINYFNLIILGCQISPLTERIKEIEKMWNLVILVTFGAFIFSSICLCLRASGMVGKVIGSITLLIALACLSSPAVGGIMISKALTQYCDRGRPYYKKIDGPLPCYIHLQGIFTLGVTLMAAVTGALMIKHSAAAEAKGTTSSSGWTSNTFRREAVTFRRSKRIMMDHVFEFQYWETKGYRMPWCRSQCNKKSAVLGLMVQMSHSSMLFNFLLRIWGYATAMFSWLYLGNTFSQVLLRSAPRRMTDTSQQP